METQFTKREFAKTQTSLLTKAMLIAGAFFILIGLGSGGFSYVFKQGMDTRIGLPIMMLIMLASMIISMLGTKSLGQGKAGFTVVLIYAMYVVCESVVFGYLFALARFSGVPHIGASFVIAGGIFAICALMAKAMSSKGIFTLGKMIGAAAIAMTILMLITLIVMIVGLASRQGQGGQATDGLFVIMMFIMSFVTTAYIIIDIGSISRTSEFLNYTGEEANKAIIGYVGYRLLVDLLNLVLIVIGFMLRFFRER